MKIRGNTVGTTMKRPDFNQTDERKSDYIKNNPIPAINERDEGKVPMVKDGAYVLSDELWDIREAISGMGGEIDGIKSRLDEAENNCQAANGDIKVIQEETIPAVKTELEAKVDAVNEKSDGIGERVGTLESTVKTQGTSISDLGEEIANVRDSIPEVKTNLYDFVGGGAPSDTATVSQRALVAEFDNYVTHSYVDSHIPEVKTDLHDVDEEGPSDTATVSQAALLREFDNVVTEAVAAVDRKYNKTYKLLEEFTTTEEMTAYYYRTSEHNRSPLKAALVRMEIEAGEATGQVNCSFRNGTTDLCRTSTQAIATAKRYYIFEAFKDYNKWMATRRGGSTAYEQAIYSWVNVPVINEANIDVIYISAQTSGVSIPIGTKISIYGVEG